MSRNRRGVQVSEGEVKELSLSWSVAYDMAIKKFGSRIDTLPRYSKGPRAGMLKGFLSYTKITEGGWSYSQQKVVFPGTHDWKLIDDKNVTIAVWNPDLKRAFWMADEAAERDAYDALAPIRGMVISAQLEARVEERAYSSISDREVVFGLSRWSQEYYWDLIHSDAPTFTEFKARRSA